MKTNLFSMASMDWDSEEALLPFLKYVYQANNIKHGEALAPQKMTGGVFRIGETVIKIFRPSKDAIEHEREYSTELAAMNFCKRAGVLTPEIICTGTVHDALCSVPYIVMRYIDGVESIHAVPGYTRAEKAEFAIKLKDVASKIHMPADIDIPRYSDSVKLDGLWSHMPESFREDRKRYLSSITFPEPVFAHGDLGHRNIMIDKQGRLNLIDFSESLIAPHYYDWSFIYNDGDFGNDPVVMKAYFGDYRNDEFYETQMIAWLINWFGAIFIDWRSREMGVDYTSITSVNALKSLIVKLLNR